MTWCDCSLIICSWKPRSVIILIIKSIVPATNTKHRQVKTRTYCEWHQTKWPLLLLWSAISDWNQFIFTVSSYFDDILLIYFKKFCKTRTLQLLTCEDLLIFCILCQTKYFFCFCINVKINCRLVRSKNNPHVQPEGDYIIQYPTH